MTTASKITLARIALIPAFMAALYYSHLNPGSKRLMLAVAIFILASVTDFVDGYIARHYNQVTDFGKFLDPLADTRLTFSAMAYLCEMGHFPAWALMIILTREFAVTGLRLIAVQKGNVIAAGWSGKVKTATTMIGLVLLLALPQLDLLSWVRMSMMVITTLYSGIEYFIDNWNCLWDK